MRVTPVILVGGMGTRLWPLSRRERPKQFHALTGAASMLAETARRVTACIGSEVEFDSPIVICGEEHAALVREQLAEAGLESGRIVIEPVGRSTAPCAVVAATLVGAEEAQRLILLLPSDHHVSDTEGFRAAIARGAGSAASGRLLTFGVPAVRPETGYGYIFAEGEGDVRPVSRFVEKPDAATAAGYVADGRYFWNAGVFLMRADMLLEEMARFEPEILASARAAVERATKSEDGLRLDAVAFSACRLESLDRAVMERTERAAVAPIDIGWSDVGSFDALWETAEKDASGNAVEGEAELVEARNNLVRSDAGLVVLLGVEDLIVVVDKGIVLVTRRENAQGVKTVVDRLRDQGRDDLL